jgi:quercetin dioxygenase-like cupin family protein
MKSGGVFLAVLALAGCQPASEEAPAIADSTEANSEEFFDPAVAAPGMYTVELDNDYVKVLREKSEGDVPMHSHRDRVSVYLTEVKATITERGGEPVKSSRAADSVSWSDATTHSAIVESPIELVSIELKDLDGAEIPLSDVDATKTDAEHHEVLLENDRVRVLRMTYPAGATSPVHEHRPGAMVVLQGGRSRNIREGESEEETEAARGDVGWSEGSPPHATENLGDTDIVVIRVELKRKPGAPT